MKKITLILILFIALKNNAQSNGDTRVITTGVPFLLISSDARSSGLADMGAATSPDIYANDWNASKIIFAKNKQGFGITYTPYLREIVNDIFLGGFNYYNKLDERSGFTVGFRYFSLGDVIIQDSPTAVPFNERPNELAFGGNYALKLSESYSMSVGLKYLSSDLRISSTTNETSPASSMGIDLGGYLQTKEKAYGSFNGKFRAGWSIQNLGPKIKYTDQGQENFLPTNLRLGGGFDFIFDEYNRLETNLEVTKLLVPTPPLLDWDDADNDGDTTEILSGKDNDVSWFSGVFQSFGDAPGGMSEEMREFTLAVGAEYWYKDSFAFRAGYFSEAEDKGARKFLSLGAGFQYNVVNVDLSYLFSAAKTQNPLDGTLRFSLGFYLDNLGKK